jgi:hypothetical protein
MHHSFTHLVFRLTKFLKGTRFSTIRAYGPSLWAFERSTQVLVAAMQQSIIACEESGLHKASTVDKYKSLYQTQLPHQQHFLPIPIHYPSLLSSNHRTTALPQPPRQNVRLHGNLIHEPTNSPLPYRLVSEISGNSCEV